MTETGGLVLRIERTFHAPIEDVFEAWSSEQVSFSGENQTAQQQAYKRLFYGSLHALPPTFAWASDRTN